MFAGSFNRDGSMESVDYTRRAYQRGDYSSLLNPILGGDGPFNFTMTRREDSNDGGVSSGFAGGPSGGGGGGGGGGVSGGSGYRALGNGDINKPDDAPVIAELKIGDGYSADGSTDNSSGADYWNDGPSSWSESDSIVPSVRAGTANLVVADTSDTLLTTLAVDPPSITLNDPIEPAHAPEPATLSLVLLGGAGLMRVIRRQRAKV